MFVNMEYELLTWSEKLDLLKIGESKELSETDNIAGVYSGRTKLKPKKFSIRKHPATKLYSVIRTK